MQNKNKKAIVMDNWKFILFFFVINLPVKYLLKAKV